MAFPNTTLIDSLQGANSNPIAAPWQGPTENGKGQIQIVSNRAACQAPFSSSANWANIVASEEEAWITVFVLPGGGGAGAFLEIRVQNSGNTATATCYRFVYIPGTGFQLYTLTAGHTFTQIGSTFNPRAMNAGDQLGLSVSTGATTNTISGYYGIGNAFTLVNAFTDSTINGTGTIGFGGDDTTVRFINIGGGSVSLSDREKITLQAVRTASTW